MNDELLEPELLEEEKGFQPQNEDTDWGSVRITRKNEMTYNLVKADGNYTAKSNDRYIIAVGTGNSTITIPESDIGKLYTIKNFSGGVVTIEATNSTIDSFSSNTLNATFNAVTIINGGIVPGGANGNGWSIVNEI